MATIDGMLISDAESSGAVFLLDGPSEKNSVTAIGDMEVEVAKSSSVIVARGPRVADFSVARDRGLLAANRALDLLFWKGHGALRIKRAADEHIASCFESRGPRLKLVFSPTVVITIPEMTVTQGGKVISPPEPIWHESLAYFRYSQLTDDLFDSYRWTYLAVESALGSLAPQLKGEREASWLERAIREVSAVIDLSRFFPASSAPPVEDFSQEIREARNAAFHAKGMRFAPDHWSDREEVLAALRKIAELYVALMTHLTGFRRSRSFMFPKAFFRDFDAPESTVQVFATDDRGRFEPRQTLLNPSGGRLVELLSAVSFRLGQPFVRVVSGSAESGGLGELDGITGVGFVLNEEPFAMGSLEGRLLLGGEGLDVEFNVHLQNASFLRDRFLL